MENGGNLLRRMEESVVVENMQSTPVDVPNSGGWGVRVLREERAVDSSGRAHALPALTPNPLRPPTLQNTRYELFELVTSLGAYSAVAIVTAPRACTNSGLRVHGYGGSPPTQRGL